MMEDSATLAKSALELYRRLGEGNISTGYEEVDALIGGIEGGMSYLFYGEGKRVNELVHSLLVSAVTPKGNRAVYFNNTDYYTAKTLLSPPLLGELAKRRGLEPLELLERIYVVAAYNAGRQELAAQEARGLLKGEPRIRLVLVHNASCFLGRERGAKEALARALGLLKEACASRVSLVATAGGKRAKGGLLEPLGGAFFRARLWRPGLPHEGEGAAAQASLAPRAPLRALGE